MTMAGMIWTALDLRALARRQPAARLTAFSAVALAMLAVQLVYGALMAGWRASIVDGDVGDEPGWLTNVCAERNTPSDLP